MAKVHAPFVRNPYNYDLDAASLECALPAGGESVTVQAMAEDADINVLMKRYGITGHLPENPRVPQYGDFEGVQDFRSALEAVRAAQEKFMEYPAEVRARFENDPQRMLEFFDDGSNRDEAVRLGLLKPPPPRRRPPPLRLLVSLLGLQGSDLFGGVNDCFVPPFAVLACDPVSFQEVLDGEHGFADLLDIFVGLEKPLAGFDPGLHRVFDSIGAVHTHLWITP